MHPCQIDNTLIYVDIPEVNMEDAQEFLKTIEY